MDSSARHDGNAENEPFLIFRKHRPRAESLAFASAMCHAPGHEPGSYHARGVTIATTTLMHIPPRALSPTLYLNLFSPTAANKPVHDPTGDTLPDTAHIDTIDTTGIANVTGTAGTVGPIGTVEPIGTVGTVGTVDMLDMLDVHSRAMPSPWSEHACEHRLASDEWRRTLQRVGPRPRPDITPSTGIPRALHSHLRKLKQAWRDTVRHTTGATPAPVSSTDGRQQASAYRNVLSQMTPLVGADAAHDAAQKTSKLVHIAQHVDRIDAWIEARGHRDIPADLLEQRNVMAAALINYDVYFDHAVPQILPARVRRLESHDDNGPEQSGHFAAIYSDTLSCKIVVANRGTEMGIAGRAAIDWMQNVRQALGLASSQYTRAIGLARSLAWKYGATNLVFTGHSLGGGLATAQTSVVPGSSGLTFDSAGLHNRTVARHSASPAASRIKAYYVQGEALSLVQATVKSAEHLAMHTPFIGKAMGWASRLMIPRPVGQRIGLPAASPPAAPVACDEPASPIHDAAADTTSRTSPARGIRGAIGKHAMPEMIHALFDRLPKRKASRDDMCGVRGVTS